MNHEHDRMIADLLLGLGAAVERVDPLLESVQQQAQHMAETPGEDASWRYCPLCAAVAALRGQQPELATAAAEHLSGLLSVVRVVAREAAAARSAGTDDAGPAAADEPGPQDSQAQETQAQETQSQETQVQRSRAQRIPVRSLREPR